MEQDLFGIGVAEVASCTAAAAHRRDHEHHTRVGFCRPHVVEVISLGGRAVAVCHDCRADSGFLPRADADRLAYGHQQATRLTDVPLGSAAA